jgi:hypothetical protein
MHGRDEKSTQDFSPKPEKRSTLGEPRHRREHEIIMELRTQAVRL